MKNVFLAATVMALLCIPASGDATITKYNFKSASALENSDRRQPPLRSNSSDVRELVRSEAIKQGVPVRFALGVAEHESKFRCSAVGSHGERGVMQIKPATARGIGYTGTARGLNDCRIGIYWGIKYLKMAISQAKGDLKRAAFLYNAGLGAKTRNPARRPYVVALFRKKVLTE